MTRAFGAFLLLPLLAGCGDDQDPDGAKELWDRIHADGYQDWTNAPGFETPQSSDAPHGGDVVIYLNDVMVQALQTEGLTAWPEAALIVKDAFDGADVNQVAAMEKRSGQWYWAEWDADGESIYSGNPETCTDCHGAGSDFVRAFGLP